MKNIVKLAILNSKAILVLLIIVLLTTVGCHHDDDADLIKPDQNFIVVDFVPDIVINDQTSDTLYIDINQDGTPDFRIYQYVHTSTIINGYVESVNPECSLASGMLLSTGDTINDKLPWKPYSFCDNYGSRASYFEVRMEDSDGGGYRYGWLLYVAPSWFKDPKRTIDKHVFCKLLNYEITVGQERINN